jgi:hypothetical protein
VDLRSVGQEERGAPPAVAALLAGVGLSAACLVLAALVGPPYLDLSSLNPFVAAFAATAFAALFAVPFAANRLLVRARPERAESWEPAMLVWGGVALALLLLSALLVFPGELSAAESLADAAGLVVLIESGLVVLVLVGWLLAG